MSTKPQTNESDGMSSGEQRAGEAGQGVIDRLTVVAAELSGKWQIPLLVVSLVLLGLAVWRLRPQPTPPTFDQLLAKAVSLKEASKYDEASKYAESLLATPNRSPSERAGLHRVIGEVIFAHESENAIHGQTNCRRLLLNLDQSLLEGEQFTAEAHRMRALAREWLSEPNEAVAEYRQALAKGIDNPWPIRQRALQLQRGGKMIADEPYQRELSEFMSARDVPGDIRFWAAEQSITLMADAGKHVEADQFLSTYRELFESSPLSGEYSYLQALAWYHVGRFDDAERLLRQLREQVVPGVQLYAQVGWLLGKIMQHGGMPEAALSLFNEVIDKGMSGPSRLACVLGRAGCLAEIERYDESIAALEEVIRLMSETPLMARIDLKDVRDSATVWYQALYASGRLDWAMVYLKLAARLAPAADAVLQASYIQRVADLASRLGDAALARGDKPDADAAVEHQAARKYLNEAGEQYLRLTSLSVLDKSEAMDAVWKAADAYNRAGERGRNIEVLEAFVRQYPDSTRVPEALRQLGFAYQSANDLPKAIESYQQNLISFPRTPAALASLIPLSDCFMAMGASDKAEQMLLRIVSPRPSDELALITPEANEYREAMFRLGELYMRSEQYEKAIARYEEVMDRYVDDPRVDRTTFNLADAYRRSAARIRQDLEDPRNTTQRDSLRAAHQARLLRAREMFERVMEQYRKRPESSLDKLDQTCLMLSHLYAADAVYDLSLVVEAGSSEPFARSLPMYEKAATIYQRDPIAMSAYVQIVNCYLRLGKLSQAWMALQRARWALRNIPDQAFLDYSPDKDRAYWDNYLNWLEKKPTFASLAIANAG